MVLTSEDIDNLDISGFNKTFIKIAFIIILLLFLFILFSNLLLKL